MDWFGKCDIPNYIDYWVCTYTSNNTSATCGAQYCYRFGASEITPSFVLNDSCCSISSIDSVGFDVRYNFEEFLEIY